MIKRQLTGLAVVVAVSMLAPPARAQRVDSSVEAAGQTGAKPLWFRGSGFMFDQSISADTLSPGAALTYQPSYQWWMSLRPRAYFTRSLSLRLRMDLSVEWLEGSETRYIRQAQQGDLWTDFVYTPPLFKGFDSLVGLRAIWGTSNTSIAQQSVVRLGATLGLGRGFQTRIGTFDVRSGLFGVYNFALHGTSSIREEGLPGGGIQNACQSPSFNPVACSAGPGRNPQFTLLWSFSAAYNPIPKLSFGGSFILIDSILYALPDVTIGGTPSTPAVVVSPMNDQRQRMSTWILFNIDYTVLPWMTMSIGYYCFRSLLDPDGSYGNPFYQPGNGSRVFLTAIFSIDGIYTAAKERYKKAHPAKAAELDPLSPLTASASP